MTVKSCEGVGTNFSSHPCPPFDLQSLYGNYISIVLQTCMIYIYKTLMAAWECPVFEASAATERRVEMKMDFWHGLFFGSLYGPDGEVVGKK